MLQLTDGLSDLTYRHYLSLRSRAMSDEALDTVKMIVKRANLRAAPFKHAGRNQRIRPLNILLNE